MHFTKTLLTTIVCSILLVAFQSCGTAHQAVDKSGRVLAHGARKIERHLPE